PRTANRVLLGHQELERAPDDAATGPSREPVWPFDPSAGAGVRQPGRGRAQGSAEPGGDVRLGPLADPAEAEGRTWLSRRAKSSRGRGGQVAPPGARPLGAPVVVLPRPGVSCQKARGA